MHVNSNSVPNSHFEFRFWAKRSWKCQFFRLRGHRSCNFNSVSKKRPTFVTPLILLQLLTEISWQKHTVQHVEPNLSSRRCALFFSLEGWGHCTEHKQKWVLQECFDQHWKPSFSESSLLFWARAGFQLHLLYKKHFEKKHQQVFTLPKLSSLECSKVGTNDFQQAMLFLGTTQKFAIYKSRVDKLVVFWGKFVNRLHLWQVGCVSRWNYVFNKDVSVLLLNPVALLQCWIEWGVSFEINN